MHIRVIPLARVCIGVEFLPHNKRQVEMIYLKPGIVVTSIALSLGLVNSIPSPVHKHIVKPKLVQPVIVKETSQFAKWDTTNYDKTATLPDATDPTRLLPGAVQEKFACIRKLFRCRWLVSIHAKYLADGPECIPWVAC